MKFIKQIIFIILSLLWGLCAVDLIAQPASWTEVTDYEYVVTDLAFDDTGNLFVSKQNGTVFVNGDTLVVFPCWNQNEMGLVGITYANDLLYVHVSGTDSVQRVIAYDPFAETFDTILEVSYKTNPFNTNHRGGDIVVRDSTIYTSFGYGAIKNDAQNFSNLRGKLVSITPDGTIGIIGFGLRNPFRFDIDEYAESLFIGDVGSTLYEEIDLAIITEDTLLNFGWPCMEGDSIILDTCEYEYVYPWEQFPNPPGSGTPASIIGGCFYNDAWYYTDHYTGKGGNTVWPESIEFPQYTTGMAVNPYSNQLWISTWGGKIYAYNPTVLSLPDSIPKKNDYVPRLRPCFYCTDLYIDMLNRVFSKPEPWIIYWSTRLNRKIMVITP